MSGERVFEVVHRGYRALGQVYPHPEPSLGPILLVGGAMQRKEGWGRFEGVLRRESTVVTVDLPGWGGAEVLPARYGIGFLADCLAADDVAVTIAGGGEAAVAAVERATYDAIFCDIRMPGIDGFETHRRIAAAAPGQARRLVFVTGDILSGETRERIANVGAAVIEKPFDPAAVRAALAAFTGAAEPLANNN